MVLKTDIRNEDLVLILRLLVRTVANMTDTKGERRGTWYIFSGVFPETELGTGDKAEVLALMSGSTCSSDLKLLPSL